MKKIVLMLSVFLLLVGCSGDKQEKNMSITVNLRYTGVDGNAKKFAEEMVSSGTVAAISVIHAQPGQSGVFESLMIRPDIRDKYVKVVDMTAREGSQVLPFTGANMSLGDMFLRFDSREELDKTIESRNDWMKIILK